MIVVAVSTGGPSALATILPQLPSHLGVPVLIVQHMPPTFTKLLAERLDRAATIEVREAADGDTVRPGVAYIAPGGRHMRVRRRDGIVQVVLDDGPPVNSCRPAADVLFRDAAAVYGGGVLGIVLTGMGSDGCSGSKAIVIAGGHVIAQTEASAVVPSMPAAVATAGLADAVVSLDDVAGEVLRRVDLTGPRQ